MQRFPATMLAVFGTTLFVSASLLFLVQPMIAKLITPLLGGTPAVWNTCMVFFQAVLLAGYAYAHGTTAWLGPRRQALLHLGVLVLPFFFFPLTVNEELIRGGDENPIPALLLLLVVSVGVPFFVVSTSAPLLQKWFANTAHPAARDPYFLYGSSNLGSMLALVGYPFVYEYFVPLSAQTWLWGVGYAVLALMIGGCAVFEWLSPPAKMQENPPPALEAEKAAMVLQTAAVHQQSVSQQRGRGRRKAGRSEAVSSTQAKSTAVSEVSPLTREVTWGRRLRWVLLAAVPSSLMLGVTTYITTDIAAIPILWLPPLTLYLLSFIIVFARVPRIVHRVMVLLLPLLMLLMTFMMLSEMRPERIEYNIALHLFTLFVAAMVCHGELANDRPAPRSLTEFFLWMSLGGVFGGLFNGLVAPVLFNSIVEYQLAMVVACLLLPPLGWERDFGKWGIYADAGLAVIFTVVGLGLIALRWDDGYLFFNDMLPSTAWWSSVAVALALGYGLFRLWRARKGQLAYGFDLVLPLALMVLVIGLMWGLPSDTIKPRFDRLAKAVEIDPLRLRALVTFALPAVLCYTFVERSTRFGLGLGAILLAGAIGSLTDTSLQYQTRSFFGVLRVEFNGPFFRLLHGTTLHGIQVRSDAFPELEMYRDAPLAYYAQSGPVGHLFDAYNPPNLRPIGAAVGPAATLVRRPGIRPNLGVIGLGTGTMACYAERGQHLTFFDIDPAVRDISFNKDGYFSYVEDARDRHVVVEDLVLGDARLTMRRQQLAEDDKYGILVVDAFSSDAIPIHLINKKALGVFRDKISANGIIAYHISNRYLDLLPVLANIAEAENMYGVYVQDPEDRDIYKTATTWVLLAAKAEDLHRLDEQDWARQTGVRHWDQVQPALRAAGFAAPQLDSFWHDLRERRDPKVGVWTDDYSNLLSVFRW